MKTQNKSSNLTAVFLLVLSALFSISLLLQPFDFGAMGPGKDNLFYKLGKMLYSVFSKFNCNDGAQEVFKLKVHQWHLTI